MAHRHKYEVIRWQRHGSNPKGAPFVKRCAVCGKTLRWHRNRWIVTQEEGA